MSISDLSSIPNGTEDVVRYPTRLCLLFLRLAVIHVLIHFRTCNNGMLPLDISAEQPRLLEHPVVCALYLKIWIMDPLLYEMRNAHHKQHQVYSYSVYSFEYKNKFMGCGIYIYRTYKAISGSYRL